MNQIFVVGRLVFRGFGKIATKLSRNDRRTLVSVVLCNCSIVRLVEFQDLLGLDQNVSMFTYSFLCFLFNISTYTIKYSELHVSLLVILQPVFGIFGKTILKFWKWLPISIFYLIYFNTNYNRIKNVLIKILDYAIMTYAPVFRCLFYQFTEPESHYAYCQYSK